MIADPPVAPCVCCQLVLSADELLLREDFTFICVPCFVDREDERDDDG